MSKRTKIFRYGSWSALLAAWACVLVAQQAPKAYFFDGDEVVFEFDSRDYVRAAREGTGEELDFADLKIHEVVVSGRFNNWSKEGWKMKKVSRYRFQLRKKLADFDDEFTWEFKFLINGQYWTEPVGTAPAGARMWSDDFLESVYHVDLYNVRPAAEGNILFKLSGYENAREVILAGSFNGWNERQLKMERVDDGWALRLDLPPGRYEYKFIADRQWLHDPANPEKVRNEHGTFNSILNVRKMVAFTLPGFPGAERVILAGSFNGWNEKNARMTRQEDGWTLSVDLPAGKHYYKFIVDGQWMIDPRNPLREKDRDGNVNSVLFVQ